MKKLLNLGRSLLAVGLAAVMFISTAAFGSENYDDSAQEQQTSRDEHRSELYEGTFRHDYDTGETEFIPGYNPNTKPSSDETDFFHRETIGFPVKTTRLLP